MLRSFVVLASVLAQLAWCKPHGTNWDDLLEKHSWPETPKNWNLHAPAPADHTLHLRIALRPANPDGLVSTLLQVSDPANPRYGAHLSKQESEKLVAPHPHSVELVKSWLEHHGVDPATAVYSSGGGNWMTVNVKVAEAERLLGTKYHIYHHPGFDSYIVRTTRYCLPRILHQHIQVVTPTTYFGDMHPMAATFHLEPLPAPDAVTDKFQTLSETADGPVPSSCAKAITPDCLRTLYKTKGYEPCATDQNWLGIAGYFNEYANRADFQSFLKQFRPEAVGTNFTTQLVNNGLDDQTKPGSEANLDIQYTEAMSWPTPNIYYSTGGSPPWKPDSSTPNNTNEPYLDWLNFVMAGETVPQTISTSYGDNEQTVPMDYAETVCNLLAQLGVRGSSVLFSSGDAGVGAGDCKTNDGDGKVVFQPSFPASCPYVTTVGGTTGINPEIAVNFSGGGFSNYFARPSWQDSAVSNFLTTLGNQYDGLFNKSGRGYPDVAAQASRFQIVSGGKTISIGGTSASTPAFAGVVSLLNDYRLANMKPSLGFLNPLLYSVGMKGLVDITEGTNPGCKTRGFSAIKGWDPVTGLGTPDFEVLQTIVVQSSVDQ